MSEVIITEKGIKLSEETPRGDCPWWRRHDWSRWETFREGVIQNIDTGATTCSFVEQKRECLRCGKIELREQRS